MQLFSGDGMTEGQFPGMECLTPDEFHIGIIKVISDEGIAQIFHMNPYLMGTAGFQDQGDQAVPVLFIQNPVVGDGIFSLFKIHAPLND